VKSSSPIKALVILAVLPLIFSALTGCSHTAVAGQDGLNMTPMDGMPDEVRSAPTVVQSAYQFAVANPDVLKHIPCYCGCDDIGHTSNYDCYISGTDSNGKLTYDSHALGCSICVDITQDVMRLLKQGKPVTEIKTYIDQTYAQYGPSNIP
jgi:hypothetical protein